MATKIEATHYTDAQAEAAKLDSVYSWYDVRVEQNFGFESYVADYLVGLDAKGLPFSVELMGGDETIDGDALAVSGAVELWAQGE